MGAGEALEEPAFRSGTTITGVLPGVELGIQDLNTQSI